MQHNIVKRFRQRLIRSGFTNVSILRSYKDLYYVSCTSRNGKEIVIYGMSLDQMRFEPHIQLLNFSPYDGY